MFARAPSSRTSVARDSKKVFAGAATDLGDHFGRVAGVMPLQDLEDAAWMLERGIRSRRR